MGVSLNLFLRSDLKDKLFFRKQLHLLSFEF